jgi:hypothetical protein
VEWLKVKALSSNPSTAKKKRNTAQRDVLIHSEDGSFPIHREYLPTSPVDT